VARRQTENRAEIARAAKTFRVEKSQFLLFPFNVLFMEQQSGKKKLACV